jgi:hypothetical protein
LLTRLDNLLHNRQDNPPGSQQQYLLHHQSLIHPANRLLNQLVILRFNQTIFRPQFRQVDPSHAPL